METSFSTCFCEGLPFVPLDVALVALPWRCPLGGHGEDSGLGCGPRHTPGRAVPPLRRSPPLGSPAQLVAWAARPESRESRPGDDVVRRTEVAVGLGLPLLGEDVLQLRAAHGHQGPLHPLLAAAAREGDGVARHHLQVRLGTSALRSAVAPWPACAFTVGSKSRASLPPSSRKAVWSPSGSGWRNRPATVPRARGAVGDARQHGEVDARGQLIGDGEVAFQIPGQLEGLELHRRAVVLAPPRSRSTRGSLVPERRTPVVGASAPRWDTRDSWRSPAARPWRPRPRRGPAAVRHTPAGG